MSAGLCLLAILLGIAGGRAAIEHHNSDRALMPWAATLLTAAGTCVFMAAALVEVS